MTYLLDTNVVSEFTKRSPNLAVRRWMRTAGEQNLYLSVLTIGEVERGVVLAPPERREQLSLWVHINLINRFGNRILPVTLEIARRWGILAGTLRRQGITVPSADCLIAATALEYDLTMVTRNVVDFARSGVRLLNPWEL